VKKLVLALVGVFVLAVAITVPATARLVEVGLRENVNIYNVPKMDSETSVGTVSTFDDRGNKCYVVAAPTGAGYAGSGGTNVAISCVKQDQ
jgi:hypothetical protein